MASALVLSAVLQLALAATPGRATETAPAVLPRLDLPALRPPARAATPAPAPVPDLRGVRAEVPATVPDMWAEPADERAVRLHQWGRVLTWSTAASLVVTSTLGTLAAINQPTAFGDGRCVTGNPVWGTYGCDRGLSTLHGASAVLSVTLYTANTVLRLTAPEARPHVSESARPWHRALGWITLGGMVVQPALGLVAAYPQVIGKSHTAPTDMFPRNLRTAHLFIGYITTAAFLASVALER